MRAKWTSGMRSGAFAGAVLLALGLAPGRMGEAHGGTVPFQEDFEALTPGDLDGQAGWVAAGAQVQSEVTFAGSGKAAAITEDEGFMRRAFTDGQTAVWTDLRIRPQPQAGGDVPPQPDADATVLIFVNADLEVMVYDGPEVKPSGLSVPDDDWTRVTVFSDYSTGAWRLFVDGAHAGPFDFYDPEAASYREFEVKGSGTFADDIAITLDEPDESFILYSLTVTNGSGSGEYTAGTVVAIVADEAPAGQVFDGWTGDTDGIDDAGSPSTTLTMPASAVAIEATYRVVPTYTLTVNNGTGSGAYIEGAVVGIVADPPAEGDVFDVWTGDTAGIDDIYSASTTLTMPASAVEITATYKVAPTYALTVNYGTGSGEYPAGAIVEIEADPPQEGDMFDAWTGDVATVANVRHASTTLTMPAAAIEITATYRDAIRPVRVYILSGQSNMVGFGQIAGSEPGTLETITMQDGLFPFLRDENGWVERDDVYYRGVASALGNGKLRPGFGANSGVFGPELGFGHVVGDYYEEPVLIIKASVGNRGLLWDLLPPGSEQFDWTDGYTYPGYGESPRRWETGTTPSPGNWYAGREFNHWFMHPDDWPPPTGDPVTPIPNVATILDDWEEEYPDWAERGFVIAGFGWFQGYDDANANPSAATAKYAENMARFIREIRKYYEDRYPGQVVPDAPFTIATYAVGGFDQGANSALIAEAQLSVSGETGNYPEFEGNVTTVEARGFWRDSSVSPTGTGYHYNHNAETYMLVGDALGKALVRMIDEVPPSPDPMTFEIAPTPVNATTIGMIATEAVDITEPVEYYFENTTTGAFRDWGEDRMWHDTGLEEGVSYSYRVKARDGVGNETRWSDEAGAMPGPDVTAPSPDPMSFAVAPHALDRFTVTMTATTAIDVNGVEYYFECTAGPGNDSGWQAEPVYTDSGLANGQDYSYRVRARDGAGNMTGWSDAFPAQTVANIVPVAYPQRVIAPFETATAITLSGSDGEDDPLTFAVLAGPEHGQLSGEAPNLTYTPDAGYFGPDAFTFQVNDGMDDSEPALVTIAVQDDPADWSSLPFIETFELNAIGPLSGQRGWVANHVAVQSEVAYGGSALAAGITVDGGFLEKTFDDARTSVWGDLYMKPVPRGEEAPLEPPADSSAFFFVNAARNVVVYDGADAVVTDAVAPADAWVRFTVHLDYAAKTWTLYVDGAVVGTYGFHDPTLAAFDLFEVSGTAETYLDDLAITLEAPDLELSDYDEWSGGRGFEADASNDGIPNGVAWVLGAGSPEADVRAEGLLPTIAMEGDEGEEVLVFTFRRSRAALDEVEVAVEYSRDLVDWFDVVDVVEGVDVVETSDGFGPGVDKVEVRVSQSLADDGRLFMRLRVERTAP